MDKKEMFEIVGLDSPFRYGSVTVQWGEYYVPHKGSTRTAHATFYGKTDEDAMAKAKLFQSAPEMLEALETIQHYVCAELWVDLPKEEAMKMRHIWDVAIAAISQAKGE